MRYFWRIIIEISRAVRFQPLSTFGTLLTIVLAMSFPGLFWIMSNNLSDIQSDLKSGLTVDVFLVDDLPDKEIEKLQLEFSAMDGVNGVQYLSKQDALFKMRERFGRGMVQGLDDNPLPASFVLSVDQKMFEINAADSLLAGISRIPAVEDVVFAREMLDRLDEIVRMVKLLGLAIALLIAFSAVFISANTVRIAIADRRRAVEIMQLVGATRSYILTPFVSLGGLIGLIGTSLAVLLLRFSTNYLSQRLVEIHFLEIPDITAFILSGMLLGMIGALIATGRYLKI